MKRERERKEDNDKEIGIKSVILIIILDIRNEIGITISISCFQYNEYIYEIYATSVSIRILRIPSSTMAIKTFIFAYANSNSY